MFWFKKEKPAPFQLETHLAAARAYIKEHLVVDELPVWLQGTRFSVRESAPKYSARDPYVDPIELRKQYMAWEPNFRSRDTFSSRVLEYLEQKRIDPVAFYHQAGMDRKLFSKLKNDFCYKPGKETAIRCCLALHLTVKEADELLQSAGYALSDSSSFDLAIRYCLDNRLYDLMKVNMLLDALDEKILA